MSESTSGDVDPDYDDPEWLKKQYAENGRSLREIEDATGVSDTTILRKMEQFGIPRRHPSGRRNNPYPSPRINQYGHVEVRARCDGERPSLMLHRLHATLLVDDIVGLAGREIHHRNGCPFDNRLANYELLEPAAHYEKSRQVAELLPLKGLCRECETVVYFRQRDEISYCPSCGAEYDDAELVEAEHIDWAKFELPITD